MGGVASGSSGLGTFVPAPNFTPTQLTHLPRRPDACPEGVEISRPRRAQSRREMVNLEGTVADGVGHGPRARAILINRVRARPLIR